MTLSLRTQSIIFLPVLLVMPEFAQAHTGIGEFSGLAHGMLHPFSGLDHLVAMIAVGLWAAQSGGRALWLAPTVFVLVMAMGGQLGMSVNPLYLNEAGILASLLVLGTLIAASIRLPLFLSLALVGLFALFHGYAHGAELPHSVSALSYMLGFMLSTAMLHFAGVLMATLLAKNGGSYVLRLAGLLIAVFGLCIAG
ncbi:MAG TPA: urease accessory protein UreJ [Gallionella sp.]|jgi:urease accessory protein|nr:HupE/UreJ family protein [Gallionella sp.]OGS67572.1 MAG: urease accessory protein UreJ [Gallionellales bacterium GWA2_54_124]OGT18375.1 MAG: urease accessory protein UreJ [Gallionellales bacterium RIFOXYD12_FULL_53_10]HCI52410.1 urease accessory protein UreJ [Gallionella sp.]